MRFRFTIRDLLWLTAVAAVSVGWWLQWRRYVALDQSASVTQMRKLESDLSSAKVDAAVSKVNAAVSDAAAQTAKFEMDRAQKLLDHYQNRTGQDSQH
jgi:hypothetical protein